MKEKGRSFLSIFPPHDPRGLEAEVVDEHVCTGIAVRIVLGRGSRQGKRAAVDLDVKLFLTNAGIGKTVVSFPKGAAIFTQGDDCGDVFYLQEGSLKLTLVSELGKEATIALLNKGDFAGEECVSTVQPFRSATAKAYPSEESILLGFWADVTMGHDRRIGWGSSPAECL